jgi:hypothetical protein
MRGPRGVHLSHKRIGNTESTKPTRSNLEEK